MRSYVLTAFGIIFMVSQQISAPALACDAMPASSDPSALSGKLSGYFNLNHDLPNRTINVTVNRGSISLDANAPASTAVISYTLKISESTSLRPTDYFHSDETSSFLLKDETAAKAYVSSMINKYCGQSADFYVQSGLVSPADEGRPSALAEVLKEQIMNSQEWQRSYPYGLKVNDKVTSIDFFYPLSKSDGSFCSSEGKVHIDCR